MLSVTDPGGKSGHVPPIEDGNGVWPLGGRKSNDSIVNLCKSKDFGLHRIDIGYGFGPPRKKYTLPFGLPRGWYPPPNVFSMSHFLHLEYNFDVLGSCWGSICAHLEV